MGPLSRGEEIISSRLSVDAALRVEVEYDISRYVVWKMDDEVRRRLSRNVAWLVVLICCKGMIVGRKLIHMFRRARYGLLGKK